MRANKSRSGRTKAQHEEASRSPSSSLARTGRGLADLTCSDGAAPMRRLSTMNFRPAHALAPILLMVAVVGACAGRSGSFAPPPPLARANADFEQAPAAPAEPVDATLAGAELQDDLDGLVVALNKNRQRLAQATALRAKIVGGQEIGGADPSPAQTSPSKYKSDLKKAEHERVESKQPRKDSRPKAGGKSSTAPAADLAPTPAPYREESARPDSRFGDKNKGKREGRGSASGADATGGSRGLDRDGKFAEEVAEDEESARATLEALLDELDASMMAGTPPRCEQICTVADAICELGSRVCDLAQQHDGDERYATACLRAEQDCSEGELACQSCVD